MINLIHDISRHLLGEEHPHLLTICYDPQGFLLRTDIQLALEADGRMHLTTGSLFDLRIAYEQIPQHLQPGRLVFVLRDQSLRIMPDIRQDAYILENFQLKTFFRWYDLPTLSSLSLEELQYCYAHQASYRLTATDTQRKVEEYHQSEQYRKDMMRSLLNQWDQLFAQQTFNRLDWVRPVADIIRKAIQAECYDILQDKIENLNNIFQAYIRQNYELIIHSAVPSKAPKCVTHVLPFIHKQPAERKAMIVVDGMNIWQASLLLNALREQPLISTTVDYIYSWLPSVTNLSRQAIFRGKEPTFNYAQSPQNESRLLDDFFEHKSVSKSQVQYMHGGTLDGWNNSTKFLAYVDLTLDEAMHAAKNNGYLFDDTQRWLTEGIVDSINHLLDDGFAIYITADHGNIYTKPYQRLAQGEKLGADDTTRHIILPSQADPAIFAEEHLGHVMQLPAAPNTFYPVSNEAFANQPAIAHGGTHWLETLVPFITITRN